MTTLNKEVTKIRSQRRKETQAHKKKGEREHHYNLSPLAKVGWWTLRLVGSRRYWRGGWHITLHAFFVTSRPPHERVANPASMV